MRKPRIENPSVMCTSKSKPNDKLVLMIRKKSSLSALRNCPLGPADALFLSHRTWRGVSSRDFTCLYEYNLFFKLNLVLFSFSQTHINYIIFWYELMGII